MLQDFRDVALTGTPLGDRIRPIGQPLRIIDDREFPGMTGVEWGALPHTYRIQLVHAPKSAPLQNGLVARAVRTVKVAIRQLLTNAAVAPSQNVVTLVTTARNHVPHTVTGLPPALEMTGRSDFLAGEASKARNHDRESIDPAVRQSNE